nr:MAG TPA_asm: hypothetical protein [Caudoviricetes sp.]
MTREDIENAARSDSNLWLCIPREVSDIYRKMDYEEGFVDGAIWRINSVWHNKNIEPDCEFTNIVLHDQENHSIESVYYAYDSSDNCWESIKEKHSFSEWAYMQDILRIKGD